MEDRIVRWQAWVMVAIALPFAILLIWPILQEPGFLSVYYDLLAGFFGKDSYAYLVMPLLQGRFDILSLLFMYLVPFLPLALAGGAVIAVAWGLTSGQVDVRKWGMGWLGACVTASIAAVVITPFLMRFIQ